MRLATTLVALGLLGGMLPGCGGSGDSTSDRPRPTDEMPNVAKAVSEARIQAAWKAASDCKHPRGASRWGCSIGSYRCQGVVTDRGWSVDCAKPGRSIAFTVPARK